MSRISSLSDKLSNLEDRSCTVPTYFSLRVVEAYPHDTLASTQGLVFVRENGEDILYESTGLWRRTPTSPPSDLVGRSSLRRVRLQNGQVLQQCDLADGSFAEGLSLFHDRFYQLTYDEQVCYVYDQHLDLVQTLTLQTEQGWGLTHDGNALIISDGTPILSYLDPRSLEIKRTITVHEKDPVSLINDLEYIHGLIFANIYHQRRLAIIAPDSGQVLGWVDATNLPDPAKADERNVLNGVAYDKEQGRLFITGKRWPFVYEVQID